MEKHIPPAPEHAVIDIVIGVADRGGVENVINMTGAYLIQHDLRVRVVQLVWEHHAWVDEGIEFYWLSDEREGWDIGGFAGAYADFLRSHDNPDLILATNWPYMSLIARKAIDMAGVSCLIGSWLHNPIERYKAAGFGGIEALAYADFHLAISSKIAGDIYKQYPDAVIYHINNPISADRLVYSDDRGSSRRLVFVGRLSAEKNLPLILKAIEMAPTEWELAVYGDGDNDERSSLERQCEDNDRLAGRVHFYGWVENPWERETRAYGLVMASRFEGFPLAAIEALACGMPVISTPVEGISELIRPGENGYVYPMEDAGSLAKILQFISDDKLPAISSDHCRNTTVMFMSDHALWDLYVKLTAAIRGRILQAVRFLPGRPSDHFITR